MILASIWLLNGMGFFFGTKEVTGIKKIRKFFHNRQQCKENGFHQLGFLSSQS